MPGGERNEFHIEFDFLRQHFEYHWDSSKRHRFVYRLCIRLRVRYFMERERKDDFPLSLPSFHSFLFAHLYSFFFVSLLLKEYGVMFGVPICSNNMYLESMEDTFGTTSDGRLKLSLDDSNLWLEQDIYCLDIIQKRDDICEKNFYAVICFPESPENEIM